MVTMKADPNADQWAVIKLPALDTSSLHAIDARKLGEAL